MMGIRVDNHHSPVNPTEYIELRVEPIVRVFQQRLLRYYRMRTLYECVLVLGGVTGVLLAFLDLASWAAVVTAVTAAVTAWMEFHGTEKKLHRYSATLEQVEQLKLWWDSCTAVDKASTTSITKLVLSCEQLFQNERQAWLSTSMANKAMSDAAGDVEGDAAGDAWVSTTLSNK
jgi:hypothetical protein